MSIEQTKPGHQSGWPGKKSAPLDLLASLPLSVMLEASFTSLKSPEPTTQNGSFEFPQDISLFLSGAWTTHVGCFLQTTYDTLNDHFSSDNTDIRYANKTKRRKRELGFANLASNVAQSRGMEDDRPRLRKSK